MDKEAAKEEIWLFSKSLRKIARGIIKNASIKNNWSALTMDVMKQHCSGMQDQGMEMGMDGVGFELLAPGQLPELRIRGAAQTAWPL